MAPYLNKGVMVPSEKPRGKRLQLQQALNKWANKAAHCSSCQKAMGMPSGPGEEVDRAA